ncbi:hypothetical protein EMIHUDRAFT_232564, partial [Emiliania huxleyi CCMP1516]
MSCGDEAAWQDQSIVCGDCKVLIDRSVNLYSTCAVYCASIGRVCTQGYQNTDGCSVPDNITSPITCSTWIQSSNAICECGAPGLCDICPESTYKSDTIAGYGCCKRDGETFACDNTADWIGDTNYPETGLPVGVNKTECVFHPDKYLWVPYTCKDAHAYWTAGANRGTYIDYSCPIAVAFWETGGDPGG